MTAVDPARRHDITVIGGGPTGLFGVFYAGLRHMSVELIDSLPELGGQLSALYPEKLIFDMPGFPPILARDLVARMAEQAMTANPTICLDERIITIDHLNHEWIALTSEKDVHITRAVLIAGGVGSFMSRSLRVAGAEKLMGRGVYQFVRDREMLRGSRVLIVGGGDSACDWALQLVGIARRIILIHRRDVFRAHEQTIHCLLASPVDIRLFCELKEIHGHDHVEAVTIYDNRNQREEYLEVDAVLLTIGFQASLGPMKDWGLNLERGKIRVDSTMATNLPRIFAAGDIVTYPGKLELIATGVAEAATAVNHAKRAMDPSATAYPGHSSDLDLSVKNVRVRLQSRRQ